MAAAFVSQLLDKLFSFGFEKLLSFGFERAVEAVRRVSDVQEEVKKLTSGLQAIQAVLEDAERRQVKDVTVKQWLDELRDLSYGIDDVLDRWNTERLKMQTEGDEDASGQKRKVSSINPSSLFHRDIVVKIEHLNDRLAKVIAKEKSLNFTSTGGVEEIERQMTASVIDVSEVHGRAQDKKKIVDMLLSESSQGPTLRIISIVGMGGIGKTTLAQLVYNDDMVKAQFQERIWVCVSDPFDEIRIAKAILESLKNGDRNLNELDSLLQGIRLSVKGKKFLLILDDVWTDSCKKWEQLKEILNCGSPESRILVTTRKENVAITMKTTDIFRLGQLSNDECWSLLSQRAFFGRNIKECENLEDIGKKIADKCKGLPLAAKTLGSLLCFKRTREHWQIVLHSELWELECVERGLFPPLLLSYYDLSPRMRRCFSFCAIFPKDHQLKKNELIYLWMAQGYLKETKNEPMEMNGEECFESLAMHSFFQDFERVEDGSIIGCKMHDIVHDFAQFLTENECLVMEVSSGSQEPMIESSSYEKTRHLMMMLAESEVSIPISIYKLKKLRSLIIEFRWSPLNDLGLPKLVDELTCLRALEFRVKWGGGLKEVPREVGKLIHLRYLNLSRNYELEALPETVCELCNLQILDVSGCDRLKRLPHGLGKLINLKHLEILGTPSIEYIPKGIDRLTCLRTLNKFVVSDGDNDGEAAALGALKNLNHLRGRLWIEGLGKVRDVDEVKKAQLQNKKHLIELLLYFEGKESKEEKEDEEEAEEEEEEEEEEEAEEEEQEQEEEEPVEAEEAEEQEEEAEEGRMKNDERVIEAIQPPPNLEELTIRSYKGRSLCPNWMISLTHLKKVRISACSNCEVLPPLGKLSSLESLVIDEMPGVKRVGNELLGIESEVNKNEGPSNTSSSIPVIAFPRLKDLTFGGMYNWEEWEDYGMRRRMGEEEDITTATTNNITIMPRLHSLTILWCPKLKTLPHHLLHKCQWLYIDGYSILVDRYHDGFGRREEWPNISHIPNIIFFGYPKQLDGQPLPIMQ